MRKIYTLIVLMLFIFTATHAQIAGKDPKAKAVLDAASAKFKTFNSFKATFTYIHTNAAVPEMNEEWKGSVTAKGSNYYLWTDMGMERFFNGELTWIYFSDDEEVTIYAEDEDEESLDVSKMVDMYKSGHKYVHVGEEKINGVLCDIIDLEPDLTPEERKTSQVFKIRVHIERSSKILRQWKVFEKNGNRYTTVIDKFTVNPIVSSSTFTFDVSKHPGVTVTDLSKD